MRVAAWQLPEVCSDSSRALAVVKEQALSAQQGGADLVCFPECFLQGYDVCAEHVAAAAVDLGSQEFERMLAELEAIEPVIVVGLIERDAGVFYNSAVAIERGKLVARYRKTHLLEGERQVFAAGEGTPVFEVAGVTVGINICYDLCFAESVGRAAALGAELMVCPCNNMLPRADRYGDRADPLTRSAVDRGRARSMSRRYARCSAMSTSIRLGSATATSRTRAC